MITINTYAAITPRGPIAWGITARDAKIAAVLAAIGRAVAITLRPRGSS